MPGARRAVLVGADPLALRGLREHLSKVPRLVVAGEATTVDEALSCVAAHRPQFLFLQPDRLPGWGIELSRTVCTSFPDLKILIVTHRTEIDVILACAMLGAAAYYLDDSLDDLIEDIDGIEAGQILLGRRLALDISQLFHTRFGQAALRLAGALALEELGPDDRSPRYAATPRIQAILRLVAEDLTNKEIARRLGIRETTVAEHLRRLRAKVGPLRRTALARLVRADDGA